MEGIFQEHGSWVYWLIGVITAFITSFYMFRLMFMTFFGDYRGARVDDAWTWHATAAMVTGMTVTAMANRMRARW